MKHIEKHIEVADLVEQYPETVKFLSNRGIVCIACGEPVWGTLEEIIKEKGFSEHETDTIVEEVNHLINKQQT